MVFQTFYKFKLYILKVKNQLKVLVFFPWFSVHSHEPTVVWMLAVFHCRLVFARMWMSYWDSSVDKQAFRVMKKGALSDTGNGIVLPSVGVCVCERQRETVMCVCDPQLKVWEREKPGKVIISVFISFLFRQTLMDTYLTSFIFFYVFVNFFFNFYYLGCH